MSGRKTPFAHFPQPADAPSSLQPMTQSSYAMCSNSEHLVGSRLRQLRLEQKLSIRSLAARCGISVNTLSLIENDRTSPSLHTLNVLAQGLGVPLVALFEEHHPPPVLVFQQQGQRDQFHFSYGTLEKLGQGLPPLGAEPILVTLHPSFDVTSVADSSSITHSGREFIYCLEGKVSCVVANQVYHLTSGDSLLFDASIPHYWLNPESVPARLLVLFCPMEAHDLPAERHLGQL